MSFTDLASLAQQQQQPPPQPPPQQQQQQDPSQLPPDPRSFSHSATNPVAAVQSASIDASHVPAGLESNEDLGDVSKTKDKSAEAKPEEPAEVEPAAEEAGTYPPVAFAPENYRAPAANRGPDEWGTTPGHIRMAEQYPGIVSDRNMPTPALSYKELRDTGAALAQWGPPAVAEPSGQGSFLMTPFAPILDAISQGKFSRNFTASALRGLEIRRQEALEKFETANQLHSQILQSYGSILAQAAGPHPSISHEQARQMVSDYANQIGDQHVLHELARNDLRGVVNWLNWSDAFHRRQLAATTQMRKVAGDPNKEQNLFEAIGGRSGTAGGEGAGALGIDPSALPGRGGPEAPQTPAAEPGGEALNPYEQKITADLRDANGNPLTPAMKSAVIRTAQGRMMGDPDEFRGIPANSLLDRAIGQTQMALGANIDRIAKLKPSPGQDPDEFRQQQLEAIRQNNPNVARAVDDLKNLRVDPQTFTAAGGQRRRAVELTAQIYGSDDPNKPGWNQGMYHTFTNVWNNEGSKPSLQLAAGNRAVTQAVILEKAINDLKIPEDSTALANAWNEWVTKGYTTDPQFAALNEPLRGFASEMVFLQTGRSAVTPVTQFLKEVPLHAGKAALRTMVRQAMIGGLGVMEQQTKAYNRQTGMDGLPPATDRDAMELYDEFWRSNPNTGAFHKDAPPELKAIEPSAEARKHLPVWMTKEQQWEPLGKEEGQRLRITIQKMRKDNPNDPRLQQLLHEYGLAGGRKD